MKDNANKNFEKKCKNNAVTINFADLAGEYVGDAEYNVNTAIDAVPKNGYLILENVDVLLSNELNFGREALNALILAKETTRRDMNIIASGVNKEAFRARFSGALKRMTYIQDTPPLQMQKVPNKRGFSDFCNG